jgi:hypothetical protein
VPASAASPTASRTPRDSAAPRRASPSRRAAGRNRRREGRGSRAPPPPPAPRPRRVRGRGGDAPSTCPPRAGPRPPFPCRRGAADAQPRRPTGASFGSPGRARSRPRP